MPHQVLVFMGTGIRPPPVRLERGWSNEAPSSNRNVSRHHCRRTGAGSQATFCGVSERDGELVKLSDAARVMLMRPVQQWGGGASAREGGPDLARCSGRQEDHSDPL